MPRKPHETVVGVFDRIKWRSSDSDYMIGWLEDGTTIQGAVENGSLVSGLTYQFYGYWHEHEEYGKSFKFVQFITKVPHSRHGIIMYLQKYVDGIGPTISSRLWDAFGSDAVKVLRTQPRTVVSIPTIGRVFGLERALAASKALEELAALEDVRIALTNLFAGRGFPATLVESCIEKWGVWAPTHIQRDPFIMLVNEMPGCGFARCDRLYLDLNLPPERLKRQVICLWHTLRSDTSGNTWMPAETAVQRLGQLVGSAHIRRKKAIVMGLRSRWLAKYRDDGGELWLAEAKRADSEAHVAAKLKELATWMPVELTELRAVAVQQKAG